MQKIINKLINEFTQNVDTYTHGGSTWLIFTESKEWILELDNSKTLWYNYYFFNSIFSYASLGVIDNQQYITKWVEDNIINGVMETQFNAYENKSWVEGVVKKGVRQTLPEVGKYINDVEEVIQQGVKDTAPMDNWVNSERMVTEVIKTGIKETKTPGWDGDIISTVQWLKANNATSYPKIINDVIDNGKKINGTYAGGQRQSEKCKSIVEYGTNNPTD
jgi:hypothetical protein